MFDRFGNVTFQAVPLARFGLAKKWKRLDTLQREALALAERYMEAAREAERLEASRPAARERDLDAHAAALRAGGEIPGPEAEAQLDRELRDALRNRDALMRAAEGAGRDAEEYRREHADALQADVEAALQVKAEAIRKLATEAATLYAEYEVGRALANQFAPPPVAAEENHGEPEKVTAIVGPMTRASTGGQSVAEVQAALAYLAALAERQAEAPTAAPSAGPAPVTVIA